MFVMKLSNTWIGVDNFCSESLGWCLPIYLVSALMLDLRFRCLAFGIIKILPFLASGPIL